MAKSGKRNKSSSSRKSWKWRLAPWLLLVAVLGGGSIAVAWKLDAFSSNSSSSDLVQYTPEPADWSTFYSKPEEVSSVKDHSPDGIEWISADTWKSWDGTVYDPTTMTQSEFSTALCPSGDAIRGIRDLFYKHNPFVDVSKPTKAEVDEWHRLVLNHIRAMVGYDSEDRQAKPDHCMFARALWGQERKLSTKWDAKYPTDTCVGSANAHCGASFIPDAEDQKAYLPDGHQPCTTAGSGAEGISSAPKSNIPWSVKLSRAFCGYIGSEGFWGGHPGPFFHREKFGFSFYDTDPADNGNNAIFRGKWTGTLSDSLYANPSGRRRLGGEYDTHPDW